MPVTTTGRSGLSLMMGSVATAGPQYLAIGSGSGTASINNTGLIAQIDRVLVSTTDTSVAREVTWTGDVNSITMSGRMLTEIGMFNVAAGGTIWNREAFGSIIFDGTNELQVQITFQIF